MRSIARRGLICGPQSESGGVVGGAPPRHWRGMEILIYFVGYGGVVRNKEEEEKGMGWNGVENAEA